MNKLIGRLRTGLAWHYVDAYGRGKCVAINWTGHGATQLTDVHPRTTEKICGACAWED